MAKKRYEVIIGIVNGNSWSAWCNSLAQVRKEISEYRNDVYAQVWVLDHNNPKFMTIFDKGVMDFRPRINTAGL